MFLPSIVHCPVHDDSRPRYAPAPQVLQFRLMSRFIGRWTPADGSSGRVSLHPRSRSQRPRLHRMRQGIRPSFGPRVGRSSLPVRQSGRKRRLPDHASADQSRWIRRTWRQGATISTVLPCGLMDEMVIDQPVVLLSIKSHSVSSQVDSSFISICLLFVCYSCYSSSFNAHSYENRNGCPISDPATLCRAGVRRRPASGNSSSLTTSTSWEPKSKLTGQAFPFSSASTGHPSTVKLNKSCRVCFWLKKKGLPWICASKEEAKANQVVCAVYKASAGGWTRPIWLRFRSTWLITIRHPYTLCMKRSFILQPWSFQLSWPIYQITGTERRQGAERGHHRLGDGRTGPAGSHTSSRWLLHGKRETDDPGRRSESAPGHQPAGPQFAASVQSEARDHFFISLAIVFNPFFSCLFGDWQGLDRLALFLFLIDSTGNALSNTVCRPVESALWPLWLWRNSY